MTFAHVLLICTAGIAACAALVFVVETLVAFWFHEQDGEGVTAYPIQPLVMELPVDSPVEDHPVEKAA